MCCLVLCYLVLCCLVLCYPVLCCLVLIVVSRLVSPHRVLSFVVLCCLMLSCVTCLAFIVSCLFLFCVSCLVLSCLVLSGQVRSGLVWSDLSLRVFGVVCCAQMADKPSLSFGEPCTVLCSFVDSLFVFGFYVAWMLGIAVNSYRLLSWSWSWSWSWS